MHALQNKECYTQKFYQLQQLLGERRLTVHGQEQTGVWLRKQIVAQRLDREGCHLTGVLDQQDCKQSVRMDVEMKAVNPKAFVASEDQQISLFDHLFPVAPE